MGADIYLRSVSDKLQAEWKPKFDAAVEARNKKYLQGMKMPEDCPEQEAVNHAYNMMYSEGYFRDSYNSTSLFHLLGLSWWHIADAKAGENHLINAKGQMPPRSCKKLIELLRRKPITPETMEAWGIENAGRAIIEAEGENSLEGWRVFFWDKREALIKLCEQAIALKEPLDCSV